MQMRKISLIAAGIALLLTIAAAIGFLAYISPPRDEVESFYYPPEFFCASAENRIDYQTNGKCAAYAAAYLLRHFGEDADGEALFPESKRPLGFVSANSIMDVFERHGYPVLDGAGGGKDGGRMKSPGAGRLPALIPTAHFLRSCSP